MRARLPRLDDVNPARAWEPWLPDDNQRFDLRWAGHLYRRAAFGGTLAELRQAVKDGPDATVDRLMKGDPTAASYEPLIAASGASIAQSGDEANLRGWWLYAMLFGGHPLREKLTLFWHNHFATSVAKVRSVPAMLGQNQIIRKYALGSFRVMLSDISRDPAMLIWLDSNRNVKGQANENFARELLELFTLGVGHYSERDIREAARAFTGWHTDGEAFTFSARYHDGAAKEFMGQKGEWDGGDIQNIALNQPAAALFLARKLYRFFVSESADPPNALLEPLAERLRTSDFEIAPVVAMILRSRHFFSEHAYRQRIKSPVEYALGVVRVVKPDAAPRDLVNPLEQMGQSLFAPPNVKGWVGGKAWLNSATVLARQNFAESMLGGQPKPPPLPPVPPDSDGATLTAADVPPAVASKPIPPQPPENAITKLIQAEKPATPAAIVELLSDIFLQGDLAPEERKKLIDFIAEGDPKDAVRDSRIRETAHALMTMAEYTLA
jgi:uncharacterized protein DUF1800